MNHPYPDAACPVDWTMDGVCRAHGLLTNFLIDKSGEQHNWHISGRTPATACGPAVSAGTYLCTSCLEDPCRCRFTVRWLDAEEEARVWREDHRK